MITLEGPGIAVTMLPERGGKITSILDTRRGREWLEAPATTLSGPADATIPYDKGDMCGWDEMMPTITACDYPGTSSALPDHGELWSKPWDVTSHTATTATTSVDGDALPYQLIRTLRVSERSLHVAYEVTTTSEGELRLLWAAHPLFATPEGTRLVLEPSEFDSPVHDAGVSEDYEKATSRKLFAHVRSDACTARLIDSDGAALALRWQKRDAPHVGLWFDHREYARHPVVAVEPTNAPADALSDARGLDLAWTVSKRQPHHWSLDVDLEG